MFVLTHPQMLALHAVVLWVRADEVFYCKNQSNNKRKGYGGGSWHCHNIGGGADSAGLCSDVEEYMRHPNHNVCLSYPEGFERWPNGNVT